MKHMMKKVLRITAVSLFVLWVVAPPEMHGHVCLNCYSLATYTCVPYGPHVASCNGQWVSATASPIGYYSQAIPAAESLGMLCYSSWLVGCGYVLTWVCNGVIYEMEYKEDLSSDYIYGDTCGHA